MIAEYCVLDLTDERGLMAGTIPAGLGTDRIGTRPAM
jgi:hypothetical protein